MLTGVLEPDAGSVKVGASVQMVTLDQHRGSLDPNTSLANTLTRGRGDNVIVDGKARHVVSYMKDFLFSPEQGKTPVSRLSGGERGRLMLALALSQPSNLLVLDEPTNDLDLETLDLLQEMLTDYAGTVLLVSHDRDFIDRVVTSVLVSEGAGKWTEYAGGYSDMIAQRGPGIAAKAVARPAKAGGGDRLSAAVAPKAKGGLSFKERDALSKLPGQLEKLHKEIAKLSAELADGGLYQRDPAKFEKTSALLAGKSSELAAAEERWLELEMLREEAGG
jgi:ATP-binding cassette subfamily F protein uup